MQNKSKFSNLLLDFLRITKQKGFGPFNLASKWQRKYKDFVANEGWFILTNLGSLEAAVNAYRKRFDIEEMFRDVKSGGYNLEETQVTGDRLIGLLVLMTIAYSMTTFQGKAIVKMGIQKYIGRVKSNAAIVMIKQAHTTSWGISHTDCENLRKRDGTTSRRYKSISSSTSTIRKRIRMPN